MNDETKQKLTSALPKTGLQIYSSIDFPDQGIAKIRGVSNRFAFSLEWHYWDEPEVIKVDCQSVTEEGYEGIIPLKELKNYIC